jgi:hypothetical protein
MNRVLVILALIITVASAGAQNVSDMFNAVPQLPLSVEHIYGKCSFTEIMSEGHKYITEFELPKEYKISAGNFTAYMEAANNKAASGAYANTDPSDMKYLTEAQMLAYQQITIDANAISQEWAEINMPLINLAAKYDRNPASTRCGDMKAAIPVMEAFAKEATSIIDPRKTELSKLITAFKVNYDILMASKSGSAKMQASILHDMVVSTINEYHKWIENEATGMASLRVSIQNELYKGEGCN